MTGGGLGLFEIDMGTACVSAAGGGFGGFEGSVSIGRLTL